MADDAEEVARSAARAASGVGSEPEASAFRRKNSPSSVVKTPYRDPPGSCWAPGGSAWPIDTSMCRSSGLLLRLHAPEAAAARRLDAEAIARLDAQARVARELQGAAVAPLERVA